MFENKTFSMGRGWEDIAPTLARSFPMSDQCYVPSLRSLNHTRSPNRFHDRMGQAWRRPEGEPRVGKAELFIERARNLNPQAVEVSQKGGGSGRADDGSFTMQTLQVERRMMRCFTRSNRLTGPYVSFSVFPPSHCL